MHGLLVALAAAALVAAAGALPVDTGRKDPPASRFERCLKRSWTTANMRRCTNAEIRRVEGRLAVVYRALLRASSPAQARALARAQRAWRRSTVADAAYVISSYDGGTMGPVVAGGLVLDRTRARLRPLRTWLRFARP